jgi:hypothetical protein
LSPEDEAFEELSRRQGDWGIQGSRKHQIIRYAENVESKGTSMTQDEIIEMAQECGLIDMRPHLDGIYSEALVAFAKLVAERALADPMRKVQRLGQEIEQERNFCPRCGKRTPDLITIHTCTPPKEGT